MARDCGTEASRSRRRRPRASSVRLGLILLLALPALGVKPHRADLGVSARVVRRAEVHFKAAPSTAVRATVFRPGQAKSPVLAVRSNGPTRRIEHSTRAALLNGEATRRRVVTILTP